MNFQRQQPMYSAAAMSSRPQVKTFGAFKDLAYTSLAERQALDDRSDYVLIKGTTPLSFHYCIASRILQAFAPGAHAQAFAVPAAMTEYGQQPPYSILMLPSCIVDVQALVHILDWMVQNCHAPRPQMLVMPQSFFAWIELLKAAQILQVHVAEARVWPFIAEFVTHNPLHWEHLDAIVLNFPSDSKAVQHLAHNIQYLRKKRRLTVSAFHYIKANRFFAELLNDVAEAYQKKKVQMMAFEEMVPQRGRFHHGSFRPRSAPAAHQGGAYDARDFNPGEIEIAASGLIA